MRQAMKWMIMLILLAGLAGCASPGWHQQLQSEDPLKRIDGAIAAGKARDKTATPILIDRLEDDDVAVRMYAILALQRIEGTTLDYKYWAEPADLSHMAQRWRTYVKDKHGIRKITPQTPTGNPELQNHMQALNPQPQNRSPVPAPSTQPFPQEAVR